jgi:hypothetical protein
MEMARSVGEHFAGAPRMSQLFRRAALTVQRLMNQFDPGCHGVDTSAIDAGARDGGQAPTFILSVPRSGTTLLYQLMARSMGLGVITNLMALAPRYMLRLARFSNARAPGPDAPILPGSYGFLPGLHGLSEAGKVMDRWFDPRASRDHRHFVREMIAALAVRTGRPLLIKSLSLVDRLDAVAATVPGARIVILRRDPQYVVQSLMRGQSDRRAGSDRWEGVRPPGYSDLGGMGAVRRTAWQVVALTALLHEGRRRFPEDQIAELTYEDLCREPHVQLSRLAGQLGLPFHPERVPARLEPSVNRRGAPADWAEIQRACKEFGLQE